MDSTEQFIETLRPADTPAYMTEAWLGCIYWAIGTADIVARFREDTGNRWEPARTPMERAIDEAAGADLAFVKAFVEWVNANLWGPVDGENTTH